MKSAVFIIVQKDQTGGTKFLHREIHSYSGDVKMKLAQLVRDRNDTPTGIENFMVANITDYRNVPEDRGKFVPSHSPGIIPSYFVSVNAADETFEASIILID